jgi:ferredoxin-NADP reductase
MPKFPLVIRSADWETPSIRSFLLEAPDGRPLPSFVAGSHIDLWLPDNVVRQYALRGSPTDLSRYRIDVQMIPHGRASRYLSSEQCVGQTVAATGPRDTFSFRSSSRYLFIAGAIGIAPILSMLNAATSSNADWRLFYMVSDPADIPFRNELMQFGKRVSVHRIGDRSVLTSALSTAEPGSEIYCCGPSKLLYEIEAQIADQTANSVHFEWLDRNPRAARMVHQAVQIKCARSMKEILVPSDKSILAALSEAGLALPQSCRDGICGTCAVRVLEGIPDHRDEILNEKQRADGKVMMICVSRAQTNNLTLDI